MRLLIRVVAIAVAVVWSAASQAAGTCVNWGQWGSYVEGNASGSVDPASPWFHTRHHETYFDTNLMQAALDPSPVFSYPYQSSLSGAIINIFGHELEYMAQQLGFGGDQSALLGQYGMSVLASFIDFDNPVGSTESENFCATIYKNTAGSHEGEYTVIARSKSTGRVVGVAVAASEDEAAQIAADLLAAAEKAQAESGSGVMLSPDGCGDGRSGLPPGYGGC